jgi:MarR family transcriptional regulator for hemolysin
MMDANFPTLGFLVHDVARLLRKRFEQNSRGSGLTRSQWQVLAYLDQNEDIHQGALADLLEVEPITLGRILDKLEAMGLVERRPHPSDRRIWQLRLTDLARPKLPELRTLGDFTRAEALAGVSEADREHLFATLQALKTNLAAACTAPVAPKRASRASHG